MGQAAIRHSSFWSVSPGPDEARKPPLLAMTTPQWAERGTSKRETIPNDFPGMTAISQPLYYTQGSVPEESEGRGKQIPDIRDFGPFALVLAVLEGELPRRWRRRSGRAGRQQAAIPPQTIFLTTLRPRNHFAALRGAFRGSLGTGASSYTTSAIFEIFPAPAVG